VNGRARAGRGRRGAHVNEESSIARPTDDAATAPGLSLHRLDGEERVLEVGGEIDVATSPALRVALADLLDDSPQRVTLDFARVSFIDSSGLGVLVGALKQLRAQSTDAVLAVAHAQLPVRNVFDITGLDELFEIS